MFQVMTSAARMPSCCWGRYRNVAVVETETADRPKMISRRAKGVIRIVDSWWWLNVGITERCAYRRALAEAEALCARLNKEQGDVALNPT